MALGFLDRLEKDLEAPIEARGFGTGWFSGFFALVLAIAGLSFVVALRWPDFASMPELRTVLRSGSFRVAVHAIQTFTKVIGHHVEFTETLLRPAGETTGFTFGRLVMLAKFV